MMDKKFRNKYRIQSHRMPGWDYAGNGLYFITLVTQNRECHLGEIIAVDGHKFMNLSGFGHIVHSEWKKSFNIRNELTVDEYIIMPNHLHAIVAMEKRDGNGLNGTNVRDCPDARDDSHVWDDSHVRGGGAHVWYNSHVWGGLHVRDCLHVRENGRASPQS